MNNEIIAIEFNHCSLSWDGIDSISNTQPTLIDITCSIGVGELIAVVGRVASGKSSLLSAISGIEQLNCI